MPELQYLDLTPEDFNKCDWQPVIDGCEQKECEAYYNAFFEKASEAQAVDNEECVEVFTLLGSICSMYLRPGEDELFIPLIRGSIVRGFVLDNLSDEQLSVLSQIAPNVRDAEMRARIADVVWVKGRSPYYAMVQIAVEGYVESARNLLHPQDSALGPSDPPVDRFERALELAILVRNHDLIQHVIKTIEQVVSEQDTTDLEFPFVSLLRLLLQRHQGVNIPNYVTLCEKLAKQSEKVSDWIGAGTYWSLKAEWHHKEGDAKAQRDSGIRSAESRVKVAEVYANQDEPSYPLAIFQLQRAIEQLRHIGGMQKRCNQLNILLAEYQQSHVETFQKVPIALDIEYSPKQIRDRVSQRPFHDALGYVAFLARPTDKAELRERVEGYFNDVSYRHLFPVTAVDHEGRPIATSPSLAGSTAEEFESAIQSRMYEDAGFHYKLISPLVVEALHQITLEHNVRLRDWEFLVWHNSFVPYDRRRIFMKGFHAGFMGDWIVATHLLIPQIENSLRYVLERQGIRPYTLDPKTGVQDVHSLESVLGQQVLINSLGEDIIFDLECLLIQRFGYNLRNTMAHGLLSDAHFGSIASVYLWWLTLHLCFYGLPRPASPDEEELTQE